MALNAIVVTLGHSLVRGGNAEGHSSTAGFGAATTPATFTTDTGTLTTDTGTLTTLVAAIHGANETAVVNAVATLVSDGASPTQAHVTTLNSAWGTLKTAIDAVTGATVAADAVTLAADAVTLAADAAGLANTNVVIRFDPTVVTTRAALVDALRAALTAVNGSSILA